MGIGEGGGKEKEEGRSGSQVCLKKQTQETIGEYFLDSGRIHSSSSFLGPDGICITISTFFFKLLWYDFYYPK